MRASSREHLLLQREKFQIDFFTTKKIPLELNMYNDRRL